MPRRHPVRESLAIATAVAALAVAALSLVSWSSAFACSGEGTLQERIDQAGVVAEGWVVRYRLRPDLRHSAALASGKQDDAVGLTPVEVSLRIERVWRGDVGGTLTFIDAGSAYLLPDGTLHWAGGMGACGVLDTDPTGRYAVIAFHTDLSGNRTTWTGLAIFRDGPDDPELHAFRDLVRTPAAR